MTEPPFREFDAYADVEPNWRRPFVRRHRRLLTGALAAVIACLVGLGVVAALFSPSNPPLRVTIPPADRNASPELVQAAQALGFRPAATSSSMDGRPPSTASAPSDSLLAVGSQAPLFTLSTPTGDPLSLESLRGKAVLLEFFATWCPHCAVTAPRLRSLYASLPKQKVAFVSVNADSEDAPSVFAYHVYFGLPFPALLDPGSRTVSWPDRGPLGPVSERYGVSIIPTIYILDRRGRVAWRGDGEQPTALLRSELRKAAGL